MLTSARQTTLCLLVGDVCWLLTADHKIGYGEKAQDNICPERSEGRSARYMGAAVAGAWSARVCVYARERVASVRACAFCVSGLCTWLCERVRGRICVRAGVGDSTVWRCGRRSAPMRSLPLRPHGALSSRSFRLARFFVLWSIVTMQVVPGFSVGKARAIAAHFPSRFDLVAQYKRCVCECPAAASGRPSGEGEKRLRGFCHHNNVRDMHAVAQGLTGSGQGSREGEGATKLSTSQPQHPFVCCAPQARSDGEGEALAARGQDGQWRAEREAVV